VAAPGAAAGASPEVGAQLGHALGALAGIDAQGLVQRRQQALAGQAVRALDQRLLVVDQHAAHRGGRRAAQQHPVQGGGQRVDVGPRALLQPRRFAVLFDGCEARFEDGGQLLRLVADDLARGAEVEQQRPPAALEQHDVVGRDVAVQPVVPMHHGQRLGQRVEQLHQPVFARALGQRADVLAQRRAFVQRHGHVGGAMRLPAAQHAHQRGVVEARQGLGFLDEALQALVKGLAQLAGARQHLRAAARVALRDAGRHVLLDGAHLPERVVPGAVDDAEAAFAELGQDLERRQRLALQHLQEGAAAGGDVAHVLLDAVLGDRGQGVAAAGDAEGAGWRRWRGPWSRCRGEGVELEHADRAVPDDGAGGLELSASMAAVCGPMSRIRSSSATSVAALTVAGASAAKALAQTTSTGIGTAAPRAFMASITALASPTRSGSARLLPIFRPAASMKVLAMPPPTISPSTLRPALCRMVSLVLTLEPATMATSGRFGLARALVMASISAASSGPAQATGANWAMP
jgi:hypothetical protein